MEKKLHYYYLGNGVSFSEEGDRYYTGHVSRQREITVNKDKVFTKENLEKIKKFAESGNMIVGNDNNFLALCPINKPTKEHINSVTNEQYKMSVETVNGKQYVCLPSGQIFSDNPEKYKDIPDLSNPDNKKYRLTSYSKVIDGHMLFRIRALKSFGGIKAGDLGGYVESENNLSQYKTCWIDMASAVYESARVCDNATISHSVMYGDSMALDSAQVKYTTMKDKSSIRGTSMAYNAFIKSDSKIEGACTVRGHLAFKGIIRDNVRIESPNVLVRGTDIEISGYAILKDSVRIEERAKVRGYVTLTDNVTITGFAEINGDKNGRGVRISDDVVISGKSRVWNNADISGKCSVTDSALIREEACLTRNVTVRGAAEVCGHAKVSDNSVITNNAYVGDCSFVKGDAVIADNAQLLGMSSCKRNGFVGGNAKLTDKACVTECACVVGDVTLSGNTVVKGERIIREQSDANKLLKLSASPTKSSENEL